MSDDAERKAEEDRLAALNLVERYMANMSSDTSMIEEALRILDTNPILVQRNHDLTEASIGDDYDVYEVDLDDSAFVTDLGDENETFDVPQVTAIVENNKLVTSNPRYIPIHCGDSYGSFRCKVCPDMSFTDSISCQKHILRVHFEVKPFECDLCGSVHSTRTDFEDHFKVHEDARWFCGIEDCTFNDISETTVQNHLLNKHHERYSSYFFVEQTEKKSDDCVKIRDEPHYQLALENWSQLYLMYPSFVCPVCYERLRSHDKIRVHMLGHIDGFDFKCNTCQKTFRQSHILERHKEKKYEGHVCNRCCKSLPLESSLKNHIIKHDNNELVTCSRFHETFDRAGLQKHLKVHKTCELREPLDVNYYDEKAKLEFIRKEVNERQKEAPCLFDTVLDDKVITFPPFVSLSSTVAEELGNLNINDFSH